MDELLWSLANKLAQQGFWKQQQFSQEESELLRKALISKTDWNKFFRGSELDPKSKDRVGGNSISDLQFNFRIRALLFEEIAILAQPPAKSSNIQPTKIRKPTVIVAEDEDYDKPENKPVVQPAPAPDAQMPLDDMYYTLESAYEEFLPPISSTPVPLSTSTSVLPTVTFADTKIEEAAAAPAFAPAAAPPAAATGTGDDGDEEIDLKPAINIPTVVLSSAAETSKEAAASSASASVAQVTSPQRALSPLPAAAANQSPAEERGGGGADKDTDMHSTSSRGATNAEEDKDEDEDEGSVEPAAGRSRGRGTKKQTQTTRSRELRNLLSDVKPSRRWAGNLVPGLPELYSGLENVLKLLKENSDLKEQIAPFLTKVRKSDAPDYYDIIKKPMDFGQIAKKLKGAEYLSKKEFQDDLDLIYSNCKTYNTESDSPYREAADEVEKFTKQLMAKVPDIKLDPHLMHNVTAGGATDKAGVNADEGTESDSTPKHKKQRTTKAAARNKPKDEPTTPTKPEEPQPQQQQQQQHQQQQQPQQQEVKKEPGTQNLPPAPAPATPAAAAAAAAPSTAHLVAAATPAPAQEDRKRKRDELSQSASSSRISASSSRSQLHAPPVPLASEAAQIRLWKESTREQRQLQYQYRCQQSKLPFDQRDAVIRTPESMARYVQQQRTAGFFPESNAQLGSAVPELHQPHLVPASSIEHPILSQSLMGSNIRLLADVRHMRSKVMREAELAHAAKIRAAAVTAAQHAAATAAAAAAAAATSTPSANGVAGTPPPATPSATTPAPASTPSAMQVDEPTPPSMSSQPSLVMQQGLSLPPATPATVPPPATPASVEGDTTPSSSQLPTEAPAAVPSSTPTVTPAAVVAIPAYNPPPYVPPVVVSLPESAADLPPAVTSVYTDQLNVTLLRKAVVAIMAHAGYQGAHRSTVDVVTDLARSYFRKLGTVLNIASLKAQNPQLKEHALIVALIEGGVNGYAGLRGFVEGLQTYQRRLKDIDNRWQSKMTHDAAEHQAEDVLDDGVAFASGAFGDVQLDILGLADLGLGNITVPSHLFVDPAHRTPNMTKPTYVATPKPTDEDEEDDLEEEGAVEEGGAQDEEIEEGEALDANDDDEDDDADKKKRVGAIRSAGFAPALNKQ